MKGLLEQAYQTISRVPGIFNHRALTAVGAL
jgi:hypothetical protein